MAYIGNPVDTAFTSLLKQDLTGASGTSLTLTHAVANANDIALYINNVRQEPTEAYSVNGTTVTLTGTVAGTDDIYVIYLARAVQTTVPPDGSVSTAKIANSAVDLTSKVTGILPTANGGNGFTTRPAFKVQRRQNAGSQTGLYYSDIFKTGQTNGQIIVDYNLGNHFANGRFTCPSDGLYQFTVVGLISETNGGVAGGNYTFIGYFTKNGETDSDIIHPQIYYYHQSGNPGGYPILNYTQTYQLSANDVIGFRVQTGGLYANNGNNYNAQFMGHLIG